MLNSPRAIKLYHCQERKEIFFFLIFRFFKSDNLREKKNVNHSMILNCYSNYFEFLFIWRISFVCESWQLEVLTWLRKKPKRDHANKKNFFQRLLFTQKKKKTSWLNTITSCTFQLGKIYIPFSPETWTRAIHQLCLHCV